MRNRITTALLAVALLGFAYLGIANITKTHNKLKTKDIQLQSKQSDLQLLEIKFNKLNIDLQKEQGNKTQDQKKIEELQKAKDDLQKQLEDAERDLQAKAVKQEAEKQKLAQAARITPTVHAEGGCEAWIANAGITDVASARTLIAKESGCNPNAINRSSGACGVAQELPCGKSGCQLGDGACQVRWMKSYVEGRYGSFTAALNFHLRNSWY